MGKITDIAPQKKDPGRVNIFVDGEFSFGLSAEIRFEKKLGIEQSLSEKQIAGLVESDQIERLLNKAVRYLSFRPRSEREIHYHLLRKGKLKDVHKSDAEETQYEKSIESVVAKLKKMNQIDDKEFARWWFDQRRKFKQKSVKIIKLELLQKGIEREIINEVIGQVKIIGEEELARRAAEKKSLNYKKLDKEQFKIKMGQFLARRGFSWDVIKKVVDTLEKNR